MPDSPTGVYTLPAGYYVEVGDTAQPAQHNPPLEDIAAALTNRLHADGRTAWTGDQNANGHKITNLAAGTNPSDAVRLDQISDIGLPIGTVIPFAGSTAPGGWVLCDGRAISRTDFAALYDVIGTTYGSGNGSTTFNVPDIRGRVVAGADNMGGTAANRLTSTGLGTTASRGAVGGTQTHTLTTAQMPQHNHGAGSLATGSSGSHSHEGYAGRDQGNYTGSNTWEEGGGTPNWRIWEIPSAGAHTHTITGSTANAGSGDAHPNVQPTIVLNYIIRAT